MSFHVIDCDQRTQEWADARLGLVTSSRANDLLAITNKGEQSKSRKNLLVQLVLERITGRSHEKPVSTWAMQEGVEREPEALAFYESETGQIVQTTGFCRHDTLPIGCSLDGHIGAFEGLIEIKSPIPAVHLGYLRSGRVPLDYWRQCLHQMFVTGAKWCDWISYRPDFPAGLQMKLVRIERDERVIENYARELKAFLAEVDAEEQAVRTMANLSGQLAASVTA